MEHSDVSGWNTGVPPHCRGVAGWTSHQTVWVILSPRRDPHRKSNDQSPAFSAHCPAAATPTLLSYDWFYQINDNNSITSTICYYYCILFCFFKKIIHVLRGGRASWLMTFWGVETTWLWRSSYFGREVRKWRTSKPELKLVWQVLRCLTALFADCPCEFRREVVGLSKICPKMPSMESILFKKVVWKTRHGAVMSIWSAKIANKTRPGEFSEYRNRRRC